MRGLLVRGYGFRRAVDLGEHKSCRIVFQLHHVKARDAGLLHARARIFDGGLPELLYGFGLDVHVNVNNEHRTCLRSLSYRQSALFGQKVPAASRNIERARFIRAISASAEKTLK